MYGSRKRIEMSETAIEFPHLGIYLDNVPKTFTVFGFTIALYGVVIAIGMGAGLFLALRMAKKYGHDPENVWDFFLYGIFFGLIGARIYFVVFAWDYYKNNLAGIFHLREGGLAIYGGVIAAFLTLFIFCRIKKFNYFTMIDVCAPGLALGQAIGRWGNFFNREAFGEYTDSLFAMRLPEAAVRPHEITETIAAHAAEGAIQVHPTFLYESVWSLLVIAAMLFVWKYKQFEGEIGLVYLGGYGLGRSVIEGLRTDQLYLPGTQIPVSQLLAAVLVVFSAVMYILVMRKKKHENKETS